MKKDHTEIQSLAIEAESEAYKRYKGLADKTEDPDGRDMFLGLAEEEKLHRRILSDEYCRMNNRAGLWFWGD